MSTKPSVSEGPSLGDIRRAIPPHCFHADTITSLGYVVRDLGLMAALAYTATYIPSVETWALRWILWGVYGFLQGLVFVGIWILAHECGHGALFPHASLNNCFGFVLHSFLLVPFFSWKYTHARHHRYTNHMEKDAAFVPQRPEDFRLQAFVERALDLAEDAPAMSAIMLVSHQLLGWPLYMLFAISGGKALSANDKQAGSPSQSHFDPLSGLWTATQRFYVLLSDLGLVATISCLVLLARQTSPPTAALLYLPPYLWVNHWLVAITYLHHTHPDVSHFEEDTWSFQKGALSTVDRDFGFIGRHLFHGIIEYHVVHHLFPRIPFYHAEEATQSIQPVLGKQYKSQKSSFHAALWQTFVQCKYVAPSHSQAGRLIWTR